MKAVRCPVCNGSGTIRYEDMELRATCHGCSGRGWIEISDVDECVVVPRQEESEPKEPEHEETKHEEEAEE